MMAIGTPTSAALLSLDQITTSRDFLFRHSGLDQHHKADLVSVLLNTGKPLDLILVWQNPDGASDYSYVLLDGRYRLAAYRAAKWSEPIPVIILKSDRRAALAAALASDSQYTLPMSKSERMDAAWRLVREPVEPRFKVREVATLSGVGKRTVDQMRQRWSAMTAMGAEPTGEWWQDRADRNAWECDPADMLSDAQRRKQTDELVGDIRDLLDRRKHPGRAILLDSDAVNEAIYEALGQVRFERMAKFYLGAEENEWLTLASEHNDEDVRCDDDPPEDELDCDF